MLRRNVLVPNLWAGSLSTPEDQTSPSVWLNWPAGISWPALLKDVERSTLPCPFLGWNDVSPPPAEATSEISVPHLFVKSCLSGSWKSECGRSCLVTHQLVAIFSGTQRWAQPNKLISLGTWTSEPVTSHLGLSTQKMQESRPTSK